MASTSAHRYRGHRASSFITEDLTELVEIRARQRTFHGAYGRTALVNLGYSLTILRLFDKRFYQVGLLFAVLGAMLFVISFLRARHSNHDFADEEPKEDMLDRPYDDGTTTTATAQPRKAVRRRRHTIESVGQTGRIFGRPFVTAGWIVIAVGIIVGIAEVGLLVLVWKL